MFKKESEIYEYIGGVVVETVPSGWAFAHVDVMMDVPGEALTTVGQYCGKNNDELKSFDLDLKWPNKIFDAVVSLYDLMKKGSDDVPWNKARYTLHADGEFEVEFKYDRDFAWLKSIDPDSEAYDELDVDVEDQILTWEGLPEDAERPWQE